jgi:hypothetical protein
MATIESRIATLEKTHYEKHSEEKLVNVFIRSFGEKVPISRASFGGLMFERRPDETNDEFENRVVKETQKIPRDGVVRVFDLWSAEEEINDIA